MIMGFPELPLWTDFWSCEPELSVPFVSNALPRNCFTQILSYIHVNDNAAIPNNNTDKLYKLRLMINQLNSNFRMRLIMLALMKAIQSNETNKKSFQTVVIG